MDEDYRSGREREWRAVVANCAVDLPGLISVLIRLVNNCCWNLLITIVDNKSRGRYTHTHTHTGTHEAGLGLGDGRQVFEALPRRTDRRYLLGGQSLKGLGDQVRLSGDHLSPARCFDYFGCVSAEREEKRDKLWLGAVLSNMLQFDSSFVNLNLNKHSD